MAAGIETEGEKPACASNTWGKQGRNMLRPYKESVLDCVIGEKSRQARAGYSSDFSKLAGAVYGSR